MAKALEELPPEFSGQLDNVDIVVQDWPTREQLSDAGVRSRWGLLGLYQGVPHTERGTHYNLVPPDKITIFKRPIEEICSSPEEIESKVGEVLRHEIAHHFGISDERLEILESERDQP